MSSQPSRTAGGRESILQSMFGCTCVSNALDERCCTHIARNRNERGEVFGGPYWSVFPDKDVPPPALEPQGSVSLICPAGTAIIMDMRVWHGGTANKSNVARPMLSVHYAGPNYTEDVLRDGGSIPFFGTCYWTYHRGALDRRSLKHFSSRGQELCKNLVADGSAVCCVKCLAPNLHPGRSALRSIGAPGGPWLCLNCWASQKSTILR